MSMTELFGSDVDESEEEVNAAEEKIFEEENVQEQQSGDGDEEQEPSGQSSESEQSGQENDSENENEDEDEEEEEEEEEEEAEAEEDGEGEKGKERESDEGSNEEDEQEEERAPGQENDHVEEEKEDEESEAETPTEKHKNVSSVDLFGEVSSEEEGQAEKDEGDEVKEKEEENVESYQQRFGSDEGEDQDEEKPEQEETQIDVEIPYSKFSLGSEIAFVKLPNFLSVETKPFDQGSYEDETEEDEVLDEEGRARLKLRVENTVRWRRGKDEDGNEIKESNARIVRWSDGTMSLLLGSEVFDIHKTKIDGEHNHLFVQQGTGLQAQAIFHEKLTFRPHSTNSQTHRKMTLSIADRVSKTGKIKILPVVGKDPESKKSELIKQEEVNLRAALRIENQNRRKRERSHARGLSASNLEPDRYEDEEDALEQSLLAMKRQYKKGIAKGRLGEMYSDQESEEEGISGGLESDDDSGENAPEKKSSFSEDDLTRTRKHSFDEGSTKKKRIKTIAESDEDESD